MNIKKNSKMSVKSKIFIILSLVLILLVIFLFVSYAFYREEIVDIPFVNGVVDK